MSLVTQNDISQTTVVGTATATLCTIQINGICRNIDLGFNNTQGTATSNMTFYRQFSAGGAWIPWIGGTDFNTPTSQYSASVSNTLSSPNLSPPQTIQPSAWAFVDCTPGAVVGFQAVANTTSGTTTIVTTGAASIWDK